MESHMFQRSTFKLNSAKPYETSSPLWWWCGLLLAMLSSCRMWKIKKYCHQALCNAIHMQRERERASTTVSIHTFKHLCIRCLYIVTACICTDSTIIQQSCCVVGWMDDDADVVFSILFRFLLYFLVITKFVALMRVRHLWYKAHCMYCCLLSMRAEIDRQNYNPAFVFGSLSVFYVHRQLFSFYATKIICSHSSFLLWSLAVSVFLLSAEWCVKMNRKTVGRAQNIPAK